MQNALISPAHAARDGCVLLGNQHEDARCPPTQKQVADFCRERKSPVDPDRFFDYYTARGWLAGAGKITDWKACLRSWEHTGGVLREAAGRIDSAKSINGPDADKLKKMIEEKFMRKKEEDCP